MLIFCLIGMTVLIVVMLTPTHWSIMYRQHLKYWKLQQRRYVGEGGRKGGREGGGGKEGREGGGREGRGGGGREGMGEEDGEGRIEEFMKARNREGRGGKRGKEAHRGGRK